MSKEYYTKILAPFKYLWKTDDKEWVKQRKKEWSTLEKNGFSKYSKSELTEDKSYFLRGEYKDYIPEVTVYFMTPFQSAAEASAFFKSDYFDLTAKKNILVSYIVIAPKHGEKIGWLSQSIQYFVEGVLGHEYQLLEQFEGTRNKIYSPEPSYWCDQYIAYASWVLSGKYEYSGVVETVDYFVSALAHSEKTAFRTKKELDDMFVLVNTVLNTKKPSKIAFKLAQDLKGKEQKIVDNWAINAHLDKA